MSSFSIVIPNLNQSHFLPYTLESPKYQTAPFELAVMDGGSAYWRAKGGPEEFRFLHISTDEVYGSLWPEGYFTEKTPYITHQAPIQPVRLLQTTL